MSEARSRNFLRLRHKFHLLFFAKGLIASLPAHHLLSATVLTVVSIRQQV